MSLVHTPPARKFFRPEKRLGKQPVRRRPRRNTPVARRLYFGNGQLPLPDPFAMTHCLIRRQGLIPAAVEPTQAVRTPPAPIKAKGIGIALRNSHAKQNQPNFEV